MAGSEELERQIPRCSNDFAENKKMLEHLVEKVKGLERTVKVLEGENRDLMKKLDVETKGKNIDESSDDSGKSKDIGEPEIYDISTPKLEVADVTIYVISPDADEGNKRKNQLNYKHTIFEAYNHTLDEPMIIDMKGRAQEHTGTKPRQRATFFSHYKLWQKIADDGPNGGSIICEDDAILARNIGHKTLSNDCITLLGGCIRSPGAWARQKSEFVDNMEFINIVKNFEPGINIIGYKKFRWTNCLAYYLPVDIAKRLVAAVENTQYKVKAVDIWLGESGFVKNLYYPNPFINMDNAETQVNSPKGHQKADFYICEFKRKWATKQGINLSSRGSRTLLE